MIYFLRAVKYSSVLFLAFLRDTLPILSSQVFKTRHPLNSSIRYTKDFHRHSEIPENILLNFAPNYKFRFLVISSFLQCVTS